MTPQPCTTWSYRVQHLSTDLDKVGPGRSVYTLCSAYAISQEKADEHRRKYGSSPRKKRVKDLPPCKKCEKAAERLVN